MKDQSLLLYQIDAFTRIPFKGNPAAVCILTEEMDDIKLISIAKEMNLSETAFVLIPSLKNISSQKIFRLRWFTPTQEVQLCGHATLATAHVLFSELNLFEHKNKIVFDTLSGHLIAEKEGDMIKLDFPKDEILPISIPGGLNEILQIPGTKETVYGKNTRYLLIHTLDEKSVKECKPNFNKLTAFPFKQSINGIIVTAHSNSEEKDFVSRFFTPMMGINEDPVTGSAHTLLGPYWSQKLQKEKLTAEQLSERGGKLIVDSPHGTRVKIFGTAKTVLIGKIILCERLLEDPVLEGGDEKNKKQYTF